MNYASAERYVVYPFSQSGHCCFEATVVDTTKPESFKRLGMQHWEAVCECFDEESAKLIADALNKVKRRTEQGEAMTPDAVGDSQWQPIETAPKRGYIFGAWKDGKWHCRGMWWDDSLEQWTDTMSDRYLYPTHWAPLPVKP